MPNFELDDYAPTRTVPADHFCQTLNVNVDNPRLSDAAFRELVRNTLPIVDFPRGKDNAPA